MARYSSTVSGDLTTSIVGHLLDAASMGKVEKARALRGGEISGMKPEDLMLRPGEFTAQALKYKMTPRWARSRSFGNKYPDYFAKNLRGQFTPFTSGINPEPTFASIKEKMVGNPFPYIAQGTDRKHQVQPETPLLGSGTKRYESTVAEKKKPVQVKDEKLGVFFAAIAESLNRTVSSINEKQSTIESDIAAAQQSNMALAEGLKYSNDTIGDKLDAIAGLLNQQLQLAKDQIDQAETDAAVKELKKEDDFSGTERYAEIGEKPEPVRRENELENMLDVDNDEDDIQDYEHGGIASGPDSGYLARLHGDELIVPLDNNYTQGQPSAVDGKVRNVPQYEAGTGGLTAKSLPIPQTPPTSSPSFNFFAKNQSEHAGTPRVLNLPKTDTNVAGEDLMKAMKLPFEVASLGIMQATGNAVRSMPGFSEMKGTVSSVINPVAQAFSIKDTISGKVNNLLESKSQQTERRNTEIYKREQSENRRAWWDIFGLFRGGGGGDRYGIGGPGLSGASNLQNLYHGTSNARASKIFSGGFKPSNALSWAGKGRSFLTPDFWNAAQYARPGATGLNPFSVKGLPNTGFGNMMGNRGQVLNVLQPRGAGLRLPGWLKHLGLSPEVAVKPNQATKGMNLAQRLLGGKYPNSPTANMVRSMMTSPAGGRSLGMMSKLSPLLKGGMRLGSKALGIASFLTDFIFPDPTAQYDQMHGPNAYYNDPRFTGERPEWAPPLASNKADIVDLGSKEHVMNKLSKKDVDPATFTVNNLDAANLNQSNEAISHIDNMGESQVDQYQFVYSAFK